MDNILILLLKLSFFSLLICSANETDHETSMKRKENRSFYKWHVFFGGLSCWNKKWGKCWNHDDSQRLPSSPPLFFISYLWIQLHIFVNLSTKTLHIIQTQVTNIFQEMSVNFRTLSQFFLSRFSIFHFCIAFRYNWIRKNLFKFFNFFLFNFFLTDDIEFNA